MNTDPWTAFSGIICFNCVEAADEVMLLLLLLVLKAIYFVAVVITVAVTAGKSEKK